MTGTHSKTFLADWLRRNMPTREQMERNRFVRPFAHRVLRPELWRFTRRSVPRGVAIGLLVGILALVPGIQLICAALLCVPCRGNIPLAAVMTFLSNPATTPLIIIPGALWVGSTLGFHSDIGTFETMIANGVGLSDWWVWLWSDGAPALVFGLAVIAVVTAALGYVVSMVIWRGVVARKWARRRHRRAALPAPAE